MTAVRFTEEMRGFLGFGAGDFRSGWHEGRASDTEIMFRLTISVDDLARFVADPLHEATASGWLAVPSLATGEIPLEGGRFNLFAPGLEPGRTTMRYRLRFRDAAGNPLTLVGFKDVGDDPGFDVWRDTTSLSISLLDGHVEVDPAAVGAAAEDGHRVRARGVMVVRPLDFARQLTTFRGRPLAVARFAALFLAILWRTYAGRSAPARKPG